MPSKLEPIFLNPIHAPNLEVCRDAETPFVFELTVAERTFFFCAPDDETLKVWMDAIKRSKSEWWKAEQERKGKVLERKPAIPRDSSLQGFRIKLNNEESAKVRPSLRIGIWEKISGLNLLRSVHSSNRRERVSFSNKA